MDRIAPRREITCTDRTTGSRFGALRGDCLPHGLRAWNE